MTIQDLIDQIYIQGAFRIYVWDYEDNDALTIAQGTDFECEQYKITEKNMNRKIKYMFAIDGVLHIEVEN